MCQLRYLQVLQDKTRKTNSFMKVLSNIEFSLLGAALVAISYGFGCFTFGLFVLSIITELANVLLDRHYQGA